MLGLKRKYPLEQREGFGDIYIRFKCGLLLRHCAAYFQDECHLPLDALYDGFSVSVEDLKKSKPTNEQYKNFVMSFRNLLEPKINVDHQVEKPGMR